MTRIAPLSPGSMTDQQKRVYDAIVSGPRGGVRGPLAVWLHRPELANYAQALGQYCRFETSLPPRLSELAILTTARAWNSEFEWAAHKPIALKAGVSAEIVEAIRSGQDPNFENEDEACVYTFSKTLHAERSIGDALYARTVSALGDEAVVDLTAVLGYYTLISMTINVFDVAPPNGTPPELSSSPG
jgi:4-carboxymuconolactone decarboxylase